MLQAIRQSLSPNARIVSAIVALTIVLQLIICWRSLVIAPDGIHFIEIAHDLQRDAQGALVRHDQHPGYPAMILAVRETLFAFVHSEAAWSWAARLISGLFGAAGVIVVWQLARQIAPPATSHLAALLYALLPVLRQNAADALSDTPHLFFYLLGVLLVCRALSRGSMWLFAAGGACSGIAFLIRPEGLSVMLLASVLVVLLPSLRAAVGWRRALVASVAIAASAALFVAPYAIFSGKLSAKIYRKAGIAVPVAAAPTPAAPAIAHHESAPIAATTTAVVPVAPPDVTPTFTAIPHVSPLAETLWSSALASAMITFSQRLGESLRWFLVPALWIGCIALWPQRRSAALQFIVALSLFHIGLLLWLYCANNYIDRRHLMPYIGLVLPIIAVGVAQCIAAVRWLKPFATHPQWATAVVLLVIATVLVPRALRPMHETHEHTLAAAELLEELAAPGDTILSNSSQLVYYASMREKIAGGAVLRQGYASDGPTQPGGHRFLAIEQGGEQFLDAWNNEIPAAYTPIATIPGDPSLDQNEIIIYAQRPTIARGESDAGTKLR